ncbi:MAG: ferritin [Desulfurococcales archaeon]|nr:ferritin [Desulfurococcales archaeon]
MPGLSERMNEELNKQLNRELYSAYLYLGMSAYFDSIGLKGFANWFKVQAKEELEHAMKIYNYILDRGGRITLHPVEAVPTEYPSPRAAVLRGLEAEREQTQNINRLYELAREEGDRATEVFLHWFIEEQVEEEKIFSELLQLVDMAGDKPQALLVIDARLAQRRE